MSAPSFDAPFTLGAQIEVRGQHPEWGARPFLLQADRVWTMRQFRDESVRLAHFLLKRLGPIDEARPGHVAMLLENHLELLALYVLAAVALLCPEVRRKPQVWLVAGLALYFVVVAGGPEGAGRYRHPVMPLLCVLAGPGAIVALRTGEAPERSFASRKRCRKSPDDDGSR